MKRMILIGLGNPTEEYEGTRHNAGKMLVDFVVSRKQLVWKTQKQCQVEMAEDSEQDVVYMKPLTYMNESGLAVESALHYFFEEWKNPGSREDFLHRVFLAYDDLDIGYGEWKIQFGKHPHIHNGVNSVIQHLGGDQFWHVRIGTENRLPEARKNMSGKDYVLSRFSREEKELFAGIGEKILKEVYAKNE